LGVGRGADDPIPEKKLRYENLEDALEGFNKQTTTWIKQGQVGARFEGGQGPEGAVAPYMEKGWRVGRSIKTKQTSY
jgi:hypothetical protein